MPRHFSVELRSTRDRELFTWTFHERGQPRQAAIEPSTARVSPSLPLSLSFSRISATSVSASLSSVLPILPIFIPPRPVSVLRRRSGRPSVHPSSYTPSVHPVYQPLSYLRACSHTCSSDLPIHTSSFPFASRLTLARLLTRSRCRRDIRSHASSETMSCCCCCRREERAPCQPSNTPRALSRESREGNPRGSPVARVLSRCRRRDMRFARMRSARRALTRDREAEENRQILPRWTLTWRG